MSTKTDEARGAAAEKIASALQAEILSGKLTPGARLGEVALADRFAVSRGPVRAALNQLSESGLVSIVPNSGARVRMLGHADARALYEVRAALEKARIARQQEDLEGLRVAVDDLSTLSYQVTEKLYAYTG